MPEVTRRALLRTGVALSAATLISDSAIARAQAVLASAPGSASAKALAPREHLLFDFGWKFFLGSDSDPLRDLDFGRDQGDYHGGFAKTGGFPFATAAFDDSKWRTLNLPHDWAVELPFVNDPALETHGFKPLGRKYPETSVGWYRRAFDIPATDAGRRIVLEFDGAFRSALVFVNGCFIGRNDNGYVPFSFDLSDFLIYGEKNFVVVRMDARFGDGWYYEGAGLYRHVWLTKTDAVHLARWESYVRTDVKLDPQISATSKTRPGSRQSPATLTLATVVLNQATNPESPRVHWKILDAEGNTVATATTAPQGIAPDGSATFTASARLPSAQLWSPATPYLYTAIVSVETAGRTRDAERISFGVRTLAFDADKGFFLNGESVKIKGTCNHQDHAGVGVALPDRLQSYRLAILGEMGGNAVRTSHNMPTPEWVEACDRMGMMMMCETRMMSSNPEGLAQLATMIKRFRNSPSIILWSMGNEEWIIQAKPLGEHIVRTMVAHAHQLDPTRLCTAAVNDNFGKGVSLAVDVEGLNYNLPVIAAYHKTHPSQPLVGSETASTVATRGVYATDKLRNTLSAYDVNYPEWASTAEQWWIPYATQSYLPGGFLWTGFDYRGEPTPYGWPSISSQFGIVDTCGFPKDSFFYYKAWWGHEPVLHLFPHWNWEERMGEPITVWVHSNLDEVELLLNGHSLGVKKVEPLRHLEWTVKYKPGTLEARGSKAGKVVLTDRRETTGAPATLKLTADRSQIDADGQDIAILRVEALDSSGRPVPTADNLITFRITGEGALLGVGNGDPNCQQSDKLPIRSLFNGLAQLIVQGTRLPGAIHIEASTGEGPKALSTTLTIITRRVDQRVT